MKDEEHTQMGFAKKIKEMMLDLDDDDLDNDYLDDGDYLDDDNHLDDEPSEDDNKNEKQKINIKFFLFSILGFIAYSICILFLISKSEISIRVGALLMVLLIVLLIIQSVLFYLTFSTSMIRNDSAEKMQNTDAYRQYLIARLSNKSENEEKYLLEGAVVDNKDIIALMLKNNDEINEYFKISKSQAKTSYMFSIVACCIGIVLLIGSVVGVFVINKLEIAVISLVSGAVTEVMAGTVLWVHNKSALQLNHYYNALHENEKFLSAIKLVEKIKADNRDEVYKEIIRKQIEK